jgi:cyclase
VRTSPAPDTYAHASTSERSLLGAPARFPTGLSDLGEGVYAWLQPNGDAGESNAGLVVGKGESLLIDTLWDLRLTRQMLAAMAAHTVNAPIRVLVNTHADGDHCWGNQLLAGAEIVATRATTQDMLEEDPRTLRMLATLGRAVRPLARLRSPLPGLRMLAEFATLTEMLTPYDFAGIDLTCPTRTFDGTLSLEVGGRRIELIELGSAHTPGDTIVHVPDARKVFAGDLMFVGVTPIMWVGPVENWLAALDRIIDLNPRVVVPGHGPPTDLDGVRAVRAYWQYVAAAVREGVANGINPADAAKQIVHSPDFGRQPFADWDNHERLIVSAQIIARNDRGGTGRVSNRQRASLLVQMAQLARMLTR